MAKKPTNAELLKTIKRQDAAVRKLTKALNVAHERIAGYQEKYIVAPLLNGTGEPMDIATADQPSLPWDMPNPFKRAE